MGLENRNENPEQQESVEQTQERSSLETETPEVADSEVEDVDDKTEDAESRETSSEKEVNDAIEAEEDFSDVPKEGAEEGIATGINAAEDTTAEDFADPQFESINTNSDDSSGIEVHESKENDVESSTEMPDRDTVDNAVDSNSDRDGFSNSEESFEDSQVVVEGKNPDANTENSLEDTTEERDSVESTMKESLSDSKDQTGENPEGVSTEEHDNDAKEIPDAAKSEQAPNDVSTDESNSELSNLDYGPYTPEQIESHKGLESIAKEYSNRELSNDEKKELSDRQYDYLKDRQPEDRDDCRVPTPESVDKVCVNRDGRYEVKQDWRDNTDGAEFGSREMEVVKAGSTIDRVGSGEGKYFSPIKDDGLPYSIEERATGDRMVEDQIENNSSYHQYEVKQDLSRENIESAIESHYSGAELETMKKELNAYYEDCCDPMAPLHEDEPYSDKPANEVDGVKAGKIDHMFTENDGGGSQYIMPFSASEMCKMELIEEKQKQY